MSERDDDEYAASVLRGLPKVEPSAALMRRVAQIPLAHPKAVKGPATWWPFSPRKWALGMALAAALGVAGGVFTLDPAEQGGSPGELVAEQVEAPSGEATSEASSEASQELEAMFALAWGADDGDWGAEEW